MQAARTNSPSLIRNQRDLPQAKRHHERIQAYSKEPPRSPARYPARRVAYLVDLLEAEDLHELERGVHGAPAGAVVVERDGRLLVAVEAALAHGGR